MVPCEAAGGGGGERGVVLLRWVGGPLVGGEGEGAAEAFDVADFAEIDAEEVEVREGEHEAAGGELVEVA